LALKESYEPLYGARPLRRYIEKKLSTQLSKLILAETLQNNSKLNIDTNAEGNDFTYNIEAKQEEDVDSPTPRRTKSSHSSVRSGSGSSKSSSKRKGKK
jgi:hypothetical protein